MSRSASARGARPSRAQRAYLARGLAQPGGKLPLFDEEGQRYSDRTIQSCRERGWSEPWFDNPIKPDWTVSKLTEAGRQALESADSPRPKRPRKPKAGERNHLQVIE